MKKLFPLFLIALIFSTDSFAQNSQKETRPQAYQVGEISGSRPQPYLVGSSETRAEITRPRIYKTEQSNRSKTLKTTNAYDLERRAFELINERREKCRLSPLKWSDDVARIARLHSENMAKYNFFSHAGVDGLLVNDRADLFGVNKWQAIGENIAYNQGYENPVEFAVERWMQSPKHRDNLLSSRWKESGIGVAVAENGAYYFTEVFLIRR